MFDFERIIYYCRRLQLNDAHIIVVLKKKIILDIHSYCSYYNKPTVFTNMYEISIVSMLDREDWTMPEFVLEEIIIPPRCRKLAGKQRKRRI